MSKILKQTRPAYAVIDTAAYAHNLERVRTLTPKAKIMAVIKADGYGHGMETAAQALEAADEFGVNSLDDVHRLRKIGVVKTLNLLSATFNVAQLNSLTKLNVRPVCYDFEQLALFENLAADSALDVWIKLDTGMGRLGFLPDEIASVVARLSKVDGIRSLSLMSHLANADKPNHQCNQHQFTALQRVVGEYEFAEVSMLNSAGLVSFADQAMNEVRPGLLLYGMSPTKGLSAADLDLKPVMTLKSELISVRRMPAGSSIGYGSAHTLERDTRVGIVGIGYGDGYPRRVPTGTPVLLNGMRMPIIGRVSMDMLSIDLGEFPAELGDEVVLWGKGNPIEAIAKAAKTIPYELSCGVLPRVQRIVI